MGKRTILVSDNLLQDLFLGKLKGALYSTCPKDINILGVQHNPLISRTEFLVESMWFDGDKPNEPFTPIFSDTEEEK